MKTRCFAERIGPRKLGKMHDEKGEGVELYRVRFFLKGAITSQQHTESSEAVPSTTETPASKGNSPPPSK